MRRLVEECLSGDEIEDLPDPDPLIDGVLDLNSTAIMFGASGIGKSFLAIDMCLSIAANVEWHGHDVTPGAVLYVVGEGLSGVRGRYMAWKEHHEVESVPAMIFAPRAPNILNMDGQAELQETIRKHQPILTVIDTLARSIPGGDENSFETMSRAVEMLDWARVETGGCSMAIHHPGKNEDAGARGHSSLKGAADTELLVAKGPTLIATKQKNHADGHTIAAFQLRAVGASLVPCTSSRPVNRNDQLCTQALAMLSEARYVEWKSMAATLGVAPGSFNRSRERLIAAGVSIPVSDTTDTDTAEIWYRLAQP